MADEPPRVDMLGRPVLGEGIIKWLLKWFKGKPVPKYLSGKDNGG